METYLTTYKILYISLIPILDVNEMKKLLLIIILLIPLICKSQNTSDKKIDSLEQVISSNKIKLAELKNEVALLNNTIQGIRQNNSQQLDFYKENQNNIFWMVSIFIAIIGGAFVLFSYLFKRPDEIWKKINETKFRVKEIYTEANLLLERLDFQYENQELRVILNKKSLFNYSEEDWDLVEIYNGKALEIEEKKRTSNDWIFIGLWSYKKGDFKTSINAFNNAVEINPNHEIAWKHLGNAYDLISKFDDAILCFNKVIELNPNNASAFNNLGTAYASKEEFEEAKRNFLKAIRLDPTSCYIYTNYFELCLVTNSSMDENLILEFKDRFYENTDANASFEMIMLLNKINVGEIENIRTELIDWRKDFNSIGWDEDFRMIESWILNKAKDNSKDDLMTALNFFSSGSAIKNYT